MLSIGVDLAQARDRTAVAAVSSFQAEEEREEGKRPRRVRHLSLVDLQKLPPGLPYPDQAALIVAIAERLAETERPTLWVDATGVGRAVVDLIRQSSPFPVRAVTLTGGTEVAAHGQDLSVPKVELVAALEVVLSTRRLHAAPDLSCASTLDTELRAFSFELSPTGRPLYAGKGSHDDLVLALALAVFGAEKGGGFGSAKEFISAVTEAQALLGDRSRREIP